MKCRDYKKVYTLSEALAYCKENENVLVVAGATDIMVKARARDWYQDVNFLDISAVEELCGIREEEDYLEIGALTTVKQILEDELICRYMPILQEASKTLAGPQIRAKATIGGNLANSCLAADFIPPLCLLKAKCDITGINESGEITNKQVLVEDLMKPCPACLNHEEMVVSGCFYGIPNGKKNILGRKEIITKIIIPKTLPGEIYTFEKVGKKSSGCMSDFTLATMVNVQDGVCKDLRIAIGAAFVDIRLQKELCEELIGNKITKMQITNLAEKLSQKILEQVKVPNDNIRYKAMVCKRLTIRTLCEVLLGKEDGKEDFE